MSSIGWATLDVIPSLKGLDRRVLTQLNTQAGAAGGTAGTSYGAGFSDHARKAIDNGGLGNVFAKLAKGAAIVGATAAAGAVGISGFGLKAAADLEQVNVAFTSLLGSQQAANAEVAQLQQFAAKTPFSQQDVLGYAQQYFALASNVGLAQDAVIPFLTTIGDVAAVTGASTENIHNAVVAIGQIGSAGKVTLENLNQISEAFPGFNGAAAIASAQGKTTAEVLKEISAGEVSATEGIPALLTGMKNFKGAAGAMADQSQTLNGRLSTFADTVKIKLTDSLQGLVPSVKTGLDDLTNVISKSLTTFGPQLSGFVQNLMPALGPLVSGLSTALGAVLDAIGPGIAALAPVIQPLADAFAEVAKAVEPIITLIGQFIGTVGPPFLAIISEIVQALQPIIQAFADALGPVLPLIAEAFKQIAVALQPVLQGLAGGFVQIIQAITPYLPSLVDSFTQIALAFVQILDALSPLLPLIAQLVGFLTLAWSGDLKLIADGLSAIADAVKIISDVAKQAYQWLKKISDIGGLLGISGGNDEISAATGVMSRFAQAEIAAWQASVQLGTGIGGSITFQLLRAEEAADNVGAALGGVICPPRAARRLSVLVSGTHSSRHRRSRRLRFRSSTRRRTGSRRCLRLFSGSTTGSLHCATRSRRKRQPFAGAVRSTFNIAQVKSQFGEPVTLTDIKNRLAQSVSNAKRFLSILKRLAREGMSRFLIQQLAEAGPDALPQAQALLSATPRDIREINQQFKALSDTASTTGHFAANEFYKAGILAADGLVKGLKSKEGAMVAAIRQLAESMVAQMRKSLGIHSPSLVMHRLGALSGEGFALGIASKYGRVSGAAGGLSNRAAAMASFRNGAASAGGDTYVELHAHNPLPEPLSRMTPAMVRQAAYGLGRS
jgi:tape measure domain-containing protein